MFEIHEVYIRQHKFGNALLKNKKKNTLSLAVLALLALLFLLIMLAICPLTIDAPLALRQGSFSIFRRTSIIGQ